MRHHVVQHNFILIHQWWNRACSENNALVDIWSWKRQIDNTPTDCAKSLVSCWTASQLLPHFLCLGERAVAAIKKISLIKMNSLHGCQSASLETKVDKPRKRSLLTGPNRQFQGYGANIKKWVLDTEMQSNWTHTKPSP